MKYAYLTFDCYGTLIDWRAGIETELRNVLGDLRVGGDGLLTAYVNSEKAEESSYKKYRDVLRSAAISTSKALGAEISDGAAREFADSVPRWPAFPDTAKFLREMGSRGYVRYILSNVDNDLLEETIRRNRLEVDGFVTAEEVRSYKPNPGHWMGFIRKTGARRNQILHVAQSLFHDIVPAQHLGIASAWVNRYGEPLPPRVSPAIISDSLEALAGVID
jgi:2-haloalkanoic acid dehalogenase type II